MSSEPDDRITGKVAEIISDRELILNRGRTHGVAKGMYFNILDPNTIGIKDPETGEELGGIKKVKITVVAVEVADRITLAQTFRTETVNVGGAGLGSGHFSDLFGPAKYVERVETLRLDPSAPKPIGPSESVVAKGDPFESGTAADANNSRAATVWE
ncbi:hypothetical protein J2S98_002614 [Arthrobacter oryzae]|uniref:hypothetical protein n=1 Tax=Arthrobacter oryzae TaxID=409290 RepID=UPI0027879652|nr:hypothetical protein [Arthrobacter oryzae]MDP9987447.1 hypothetical protein [Arthrobacter oryzae]